MQLRENTLLQGGRFRIIRCLGKGGFGITYLAEDTMLGVNVALKEFFIGQYCNRDANTGLVTVGVESMRNRINGYYEKFLKEAGKIRMLNHSNIVRVYEVFRENGTAYYAMDYHSNGSLSGLVKKQGALSESDALRYIRQVASALKYIHSRNMVHLDIKPDNILLDNEGNAILIDFGISKHYDSNGKATTITPGAYTPGYAANSQMSGSKINTFSPTLDIYSLGATLYNLITGEEPPLITEILDYGFSSMPAAISSSTRNAIEKSMAPKSAERPKSVDEFLALLYPQKKKEKITLHCDPLFFEAARLVVEQKEARRSTLQRYLAIGFNRAGNILEELSQAGIVSAVKNSGEPCELLCKGKEELEEILSNISPVYKEIKPLGGNIPHVENVGGNRPRKPFNWKLLAGIVATLLCIVFAGIGVNECNDYRAEQAAEKSRLAAVKRHNDSVAAEKARLAAVKRHNDSIAAEKARLAAIEKARLDSISKYYSPLRLACVKNDGSLHYFTAGEWEANSAKSSYNKLGVSLRANGREFIIAANDCVDSKGNKEFKFGAYGVDIDGVQYHTDVNKLDNIWTGKEDTRAIINATKEKVDEKGIVGAPAAEAAWRYKACNNDPLQWYLPSVSELRLMPKYRLKINKFLKQYFRGEEIIDDCYWSSTSCSMFSSWYVYMYGGDSSSGNGRPSSGRVRPVAVAK